MDDFSSLKGLSPELISSFTMAFKAMGSMQPSIIPMGGAKDVANVLLPHGATVSFAAGTAALTGLYKLAKACLKVKEVFLGQPISPQSAGVQQKYEYADAREVSSGLPWENIFALLSVISLKVPDVPPITVPRTRVTLPGFKPSRVAALCLAALCGKWLAGVLYFKYKSPIGAALSTKLIKASLTSGPLSSSQLRQVFTDTPLVRSKPVENHTHGKSACDRNAGGTTAELVARSMGLTPYFVQKSLADERKGREGDRSFHWTKDLAGTPVEFHFDPARHASVFVDVDEHMDMPHFLAMYPATHFICTFQPTEAAAGDGEYTFRFLPDNRVAYSVSGGAEYVHEVWDYSGETLLVESRGLLSKQVVAYHIDRKQVDAHHSIIMLSLIGRFDSYMFVPTALFLQGKQLERLKPVRDKHVVLDVVKPDGLYRSVAIVGSHLAVTLKKTAFDAVHAVAIVAKSAITPGMVDSNISPPGKNGMPEYKLGPGQAHIIASFLRVGVPEFPAVVHPPSACLIPIWYDKYGADSRVPLAGFGSPLIGPNYAHAFDLASEDRCIKGRLEQFVGKFEADIPPTLAKYMIEFAEFVVPEHLRHTGEPVDAEMVHERQNRPGQRNILDQAEVSGPWYTRIFRAFNKIEPYQKVTDPRNITTVTPEAKLKNSRFMYAFHDVVMSQLDHYAFNKTPKEIAEAVTCILRGATHSVLGDGRRFDGHVIRRVRILERILMFLFFNPRWYSDLNESLDEQIGLPGVTSEGRTYASWFTRGSGTLETADFNSLLSMFIGYCGWRNTVNSEGDKCSPIQAWNSLGIYGGDDSLEGAIDPKALVRSANLMGQDYEVDVVQRGQRGVNFLNRWFGPDVWNGDASSMANPKRLLAKLWVGPANLPNPLERFAERLSGYYRMDRNSPVIGLLAQLGHEILGDRTEGILMPWDGKHSLESNWPNEDSGWMMDQFEESIPDFDHSRFHAWLVRIKYGGDPTLFLRAPLCTPEDSAVEKSEVPAVVGEELVVPVRKPVPPHCLAQEGEVLSDVPSPIFSRGKDKEEVDLEPSPVVSLEPFEVAEAAVPKVNAKGIKVKSKGKKTAPRPSVKFDPKRPDLWMPPLNATPERLAEWTKLRAKVAKRLGVKLMG